MVYKCILKLIPCVITKANMEFVIINQENLHLVEQLFTNPVSPHFRYYNKRPIETALLHTYTIIGVYDNIPVAYGHIDYEEVYWLGLYVLDKYQNRGFGKQIMNNLLSYFQDIEHTKKELCLSVDTTNIIARKLYESYGFKIYTEKNDIVIMKFMK